MKCSHDLLYYSARKLQTYIYMTYASYSWWKKENFDGPSSADTQLCNHLFAVTVKVNKHPMDQCFVGALPALQCVKRTSPYFIHDRTFIKDQAERKAMFNPLHERAWRSPFQTRKMVSHSHRLYFCNWVKLKPPSWKTRSTSSKMYRLQQEQHSSKQWAINLSV